MEEWQWQCDCCVADSVQCVQYGAHHERVAEACRHLRRGNSICLLSRGGEGVVE